MIFLQFQGFEGSTTPILANMTTVILISLAAFLVYWIYTSFAYKTIAKKLQHKRPWLAWIPLAREAMVLQLGRFNWKWVFLFLPPLIMATLLFASIFLQRFFLDFRGTSPFFMISLIISAITALAFSILNIISHWRIFKKRNYPGWLIFLPMALGIIPFLNYVSTIAFFIIIGLIAWKDRGEDNSENRTLMGPPQPRQNMPPRRPNQRR